MVVSTLKMPPSGRDFDLFRRVKVEERSPRQVAGECKLSPHGVFQAVNRVSEYLCEIAPGSEEQRPQRLSIAEQVASERIDFLCSCAMQAWRDSQGVHSITREHAGDGLQPTTKVTTTKNSQGEIRYLLTAARLTMFGAKLPISTLGSQCVHEEEPENAIHPPVEDCSVHDKKRVERAEFLRGPSAVSAFEIDACEEAFQSAFASQLALSASVQLAGNGHEAEDLKAPETHPPLTRQQRKARQRLLEKKLRSKK